MRLFINLFTVIVPPQSSSARAASSEASVAKSEVYVASALEIASRFAVKVGVVPIPTVIIRVPAPLISLAFAIAACNACASLPGSVGSPSDAKTIRLGLLIRGSNVPNAAFNHASRLVDPAPPTAAISVAICAGVLEKF